METVINRTTPNGAKWQIVVDNFGAALYLNNFNKPGYHYSGYWFRTVTEAQEYLDGVDARVSAPVQHFDYTIPADYYDDCSRHYGD